MYIDDDGLWIICTLKRGLGVITEYLKKKKKLLCSVQSKKFDWRIEIIDRDNWERNDKHAMEHYSKTAW